MQDHTAPHFKHSRFPGDPMEFRIFALVVLVLMVAACSLANGQSTSDDTFEHPRANASLSLPDFPDAPGVGQPYVKNDFEWQESLDDEAYRVLRQHGTERPFSNEYNDHHAEGVYVCGGCGAPLFTSADKYDSGTGWPSFTRPAQDGRIGTDIDQSFGMRRVEVHCASCGGHLGHVFPDGPRPDRQRYCINSVSLDFVPHDVDGDGHATSDLEGAHQ